MLTGQEPGSPASCHPKGKHRKLEYPKFYPYRLSSWPLRIVMQAREVVEGWSQTEPLLQSVSLNLPRLAQVQADRQYLYLDILPSELRVCPWLFSPGSMQVMLTTLTSRRRGSTPIRHMFISFYKLTETRKKHWGCNHLHRPYSWGYLRRGEGYAKHNGRRKNGGLRINSDELKWSDWLPFQITVIGHQDKISQTLSHNKVKCQGFISQYNSSKIYKQSELWLKEENPQKTLKPSRFFVWQAIYHIPKACQKCVECFSSWLKTGM